MTLYILELFKCAYYLADFYQKIDSGTVEIQPLNSSGGSNSNAPMRPYRHYHYRKEGNVLFNNTLNTFYLRLHGVGHMVKDHSDSKRGNTLLPLGLFFPISSKDSFICTIPQTG